MMVCNNLDSHRVSPVSPHETYVRLLGRIIHSGLAMRTGSTLDYEGVPAPVPAAYVYAGDAQIVVRARSGEYRWLEDVGPDAFASGADDALLECIIVAHEFGHHLSTVGRPDPAGYLAELDEARWRIGTERPPENWVHREPTGQDGDAMYAEELAAWDRARQELTAIGFTEWTAFDALRTEKLRGYSEGIAAKMPGWAPVGG
jgi:hypothetical protein